jgi:hypothetical protein
MYGGYSDVNAYYSNPGDKFLTVVGLSGRDAQLKTLTALALQLAHDSNRKLILPYAVANMQKRTKHVDGTMVVEHALVPEFPFYRVMNMTSMEATGVGFVEANFLMNRLMHNGVPFENGLIQVGPDDLTHYAGVVAPKILMSIRSAAEQVITLDFTGFEMRTVEMDNWAKDYFITDIRGMLKLCGNVNEPDAGCAARCVDELKTD